MKLYIQNGKTSDVTKLFDWIWLRNKLVQHTTCLYISPSVGASPALACGSAWQICIDIGGTSENRNRVIRPSDSPAIGLAQLISAFYPCSQDDWTVTNWACEMWSFSSPDPDLSALIWWWWWSPPRPNIFHRITKQNTRGWSRVWYL